MGQEGVGGGSGVRRGGGRARTSSSLTLSSSFSTLFCRLASLGSFVVDALALGEGRSAAVAGWAAAELSLVVDALELADETFASTAAVAGWAAPALSFAAVEAFALGVERSAAWVAAPVHSFAAVEALELGVDRSAAGVGWAAAPCGFSGSFFALTLAKALGNRIIRLDKAGMTDFSALEDISASQTPDL